MEEACYGFKGRRVPLHPSRNFRGSDYCADEVTRYLPHGEVCSAIQGDASVVKPVPEVALQEILTSGNSSMFPLASSTTGRQSGVVSMTVELLHVLAQINWQRS